MNNMTNAQCSNAVSLMLPQKKKQLGAQFVIQLKKRYISICRLKKSVLWPYTHVSSLLTKFPTSYFSSSRPHTESLYYELCTMKSQTCHKDTLYIVLGITKTQYTRIQLRLCFPQGVTGHAQCGVNSTHSDASVGLL